MANPTLVQQSTVASVASGSPNPALGVNSTAGNVVLAIIFTGGTRTVTVSGMGATWTALVETPSTAGGIGAHIFAAVVITPGTTLTITPSAGASEAQLVEFSGVTITTDGTNKSISGAGTDTSVQPGNITTTNINDLIVSCAGISNGAAITSPSTPWNALNGATNDVNGRSVASVYQVVSTTGSFNPTFSWTGGAGDGAAIVALKGTDVWSGVRATRHARRSKPARRRHRNVNEALRGAGGIITEWPLPQRERIVRRRKVPRRRLRNVNEALRGGGAILLTWALPQRERRIAKRRRSPRRKVGIRRTPAFQIETLWALVPKQHRRRLYRKALRRLRPHPTVSGAGTTVLWAVPPQLIHRQQMTYPPPLPSPPKPPRRTIGQFIVALLAAVPRRIQRIKPKRIARRIRQVLLRRNPQPFIPPTPPRPFPTPWIPLYLTEPDALPQRDAVFIFQERIESITPSLMVLIYVSSNVIPRGSDVTVTAKVTLPDGVSGIPGMLPQLYIFEPDGTMVLNQTMNPTGDRTLFEQRYFIQPTAPVGNDWRVEVVSALGNLSLDSGKIPNSFTVI